MAVMERQRQRNITKSFGKSSGIGSKLPCLLALQLLPQRTEVLLSGRQFKGGGGSLATSDLGHLRLPETMVTSDFCFGVEKLQHVSRETPQITCDF